MFEYFSRTRGTPGRIIRLNYAIDMRYGVLHDVATRVLARPADQSRNRATSTSSGRATPTAWCCARSPHCTTPTTPLNVSGPETISVRWLAETFGRLFGRAPVFAGVEAPTAGWSTPARRCGCSAIRACRWRGSIDWTADWVGRGMPASARTPTTIRAMASSDPALDAETLLRPEDFADAGALVREAGWNQIEADWRIFLDLGTVYRDPRPRPAA